MFVVHGKATLTLDRLTFPVQWPGGGGAPLEAVITTTQFTIKETKAEGFALSPQYTPSDRSDHRESLLFTGAKRPPSIVLRGPVSVRMFRKVMDNPKPAEGFVRLINKCLEGEHPHTENVYHADAPLEDFIQRINFYIVLTCGTPLSYPKLQTYNGVTWPRLDDNPYLYGWQRKCRWNRAGEVVIEPFKLRPRKNNGTIDYERAPRTTGHEKAEFLDKMEEIVAALNSLRVHAQPNERMAKSRGK